VRGLSCSDWVGHAVWLLQPIVEGIGRYVFTAEKIHGDDTPASACKKPLKCAKSGAGVDRYL
jgi:hypothetical protein